MGRWSDMPKPTVLPSKDGLVHRVVHLDAVMWRSQCRLIPENKPKGWKKFPQDSHVTCIPCLANAAWMGVGWEFL